MALESATYIDGLNASNPAGSDAISTADDHLRLIKSTLLATFPNIDGPVTVTQADINGAAPLDSPVFTGVPEAPTADPGTDTDQLATTAFVTAALQAVYPVGSIYINAAVDTNPATLLGFGTWTAFGAGRVMVGQNTSDASFDVLEETGGSKDAIAVSHTHTATSSVTDSGHTHAFGSGNGSGAPYYPSIEGDGNGTRVYSSTTDSATTGISVSTTIASAGSSGTNANLQPYIVVKMWKRTA